MKDVSLASIRNVSFLKEILPMLQAQVDEMVRALENRVFTDLNRGELTPEKALEAWIEKLSYRKLIGKLEQKLKIGQFEGEKYAKELEK